MATKPTEFLQHPVAFTPTEYFKMCPQGHFAMKLKNLQMETSILKLNEKRDQRWI